MLLNSIIELRKLIKEKQNTKKTIGFVPTMGYLHEGHLSLINKARQENDLVVVSIFVNPIQFGPNEDYEDYPRNIKRDYKLAIENGADIVFNPSANEMYPDKLKTFVEVEDLTDNLCGLSRPGHFRGVTTVVSKLFNIVKANKAYFGQKDAQQVAVIKQMVKDLNIDIEIIACPIIREPDGLAMSSRNKYLSQEERISALRLSQSLTQAQKVIKQGEINAHVIIDSIQSFITVDPNCIIDYVKIVDFQTLKDLEEIKGEILIALAINVGTTRLIDNIILEV